jgi:DNA-binding MarR family transcriptional regulator
MTLLKKHSGRYDPANANFRKEEFPFYWLARVHGRYTQAMEKALKKIDLDIPRWRLLFILKEHGESSISEISEHAIAKLSTITKIVYRMKADGLVDTHQSLLDGRVTRVSITAAGREAITRIQMATSDLFNQSFLELSEAQVKKLNKLLSILYDNLPVA